MASGAQRNPAAGFALVDALVALLIFSIGIWALANSQQAQMQRAERQLQSRIAWSLLDNLAQRLLLHTTRFGTESMQANYHLDGVAPGVRGAAPQRLPPVTPSRVTPWLLPSSTLPTGSTGYSKPAPLQVATSRCAMVGCSWWWHGQARATGRKPRSITGPVTAAMPALGYGFSTTAWGRLNEFDGRYVDWARGVVVSK